MTQTIRFGAGGADCPRAARDASEESGLGDRVMALFETGGFPSARGVLRDLGAYILDGEGGSEEGAAAKAALKRARTGVKQ